jgi:hypothetical protein
VSRTGQPWPAHSGGQAVIEGVEKTVPVFAQTLSDDETRDPQRPAHAWNTLQDNISPPPLTAMARAGANKDGLLLLRGGFRRFLRCRLLCCRSLCRRFLRCRLLCRCFLCHHLLCHGALLQWICILPPLFSEICKRKRQRIIGSSPCCRKGGRHASRVSPS